MQLLRKIVSIHRKLYRLGTLQLSMKVLKRALASKNEDWLKEWAAEKYSYITLMDYEIFRKEVCGVLGINIKEVAKLAFYSLGCKYFGAPNCLFVHEK